ncbi:MULTISPECIES: alpha-ketoglutarate-dependent dioxygenase AlkB [unclassified Pseudoxanthomonas]|uniref:alpha-ketoglutarate-dependent dioxygenase AlkB family protein n=1 Tax=unclassified Pseudoxanthomonas TaxID=2645906 RepID=UPI0008E224D1|nr:MULTISPECIES: alpha-ketoglutarate-dependent dioxygenase AlkB [unclassified Pseudoxanthomonas]PPJ41555.1 alpha-ketoglutarate-dependent dioxygenase AlkB [Pseudoxanthomonas sp. KAs_5_3]SFV29910.1 DNA-N1-methyladenine dioxygenase [Pseudoxanthomonas sp. YR558]
MTIPLPLPADGSDAGLPGATLRFQPAWLAGDAADRLFEALTDALPWSVHRIRLFGRDVDSPRLSAWIGDADAVYRYSGTAFTPLAWTDALSALRLRLQAELGVPFNSVLANLYRDGRDAMGWHSDDEPELGPQPVIASISLGAPRRFLLKHRQEATMRAAIALPHGSLLVMSGDTQRLYRHALPRTTRPLGPRINLTFRHVDPARRR